jgi:SAM-dependent methyltransferase
MSSVYMQEIDPRFEPVVDGVIARAALNEGESVVDLGTGTGAVAERAAAAVGPSGAVTAVDVSPEMLELARGRLAKLDNVSIVEGRGEQIPADDSSVDVVLASLSLMYVIDRQAAAGEIARVLRPGGRFVAAVWAGPEECDIVLFQATAGRFAAPPPVAGVGPGALADPSEFLAQLEAAGIAATAETERLGFDFPDFTSAWDVLAAVTAANLSEQGQQAAKSAVLEAMYPEADGPRHFRNDTHFIVGRRSG